MSNRTVAPRHRELVLRAPRIATAARPGQFLHVLCGDGPGGDGILRYLRRPFSLYRVDREAGEVSILYRELGEGTRWLSGRGPGDPVNVIGPLGNGFPSYDEPAYDGPAYDEPALLIGGGVGIPPLAFLADELVRRGVPVRAFLGARTAGDILAEGEFTRLGVPVAVATDDGSRGRRGVVTTLVEEALAADPVADPAADLAADRRAVIYACGPLPMLRAVQALAGRYGVPAFLCLEQRMACGVGACLGCPAPVPGDEPYPPGPAAWGALPAADELAAGYARVYRAERGDEPVVFRRVCVEGPVFPAWGVVLGGALRPAAPPPAPGMSCAGAGG